MGGINDIEGGSISVISDTFVDKSTIPRMVNIKIELNDIGVCKIYHNFDAILTIHKQCI